MGQKPVAAPPLIGLKRERRVGHRDAHRRDNRQSRASRLPARRRLPVSGVSSAPKGTPAARKAQEPFAIAARDGGRVPRTRRDARDGAFATGRRSGRPATPPSGRPCHRFSNAQTTAGRVARPVRRRWRRSAGDRATRPRRFLSRSYQKTRYGRARRRCSTARPGTPRSRFRPERWRSSPATRGARRTCPRRVPPGSIRHRPPHTGPAAACRRSKGR